MADLNGDGRINGMDHLLASLLSDDTTYDRESFEYDQNGNRVKLVQNGDIYTYDYGERNRLAAVYLQEEGSFSPRLYLEFEYDANGNTVARTVYNEEGEIQTRTTFTYDTLDRVTRSVEGGRVTEYFYDNAGNRFIKKGPEGTTLYLRHGQIAVAMDIEVPVEQTECVGKINRYVMSGDLLAGRITTTVQSDGAKEVSLYYYHLNSTKIASDEEGAVDVMYVYRAFGEQLAKIGEGDARYTYSGKELDDETNLYYFNARYYDAVIGRFISEDPAQDGLNWYVYADNNPLRLVDPTGLKKEVRITATYESSVHSMNLEQFREWSNYARNRLSEISSNDKTNKYGGIIAGGIAAVTFVKCPPAGAAVATGAGLLVASKGFELNEMKENIKSIHNKLFPSFLDGEASTATFSLHKESTVERVTRRNTSESQTTHNYYIEFIDGGTQIDKKTYNHLFENTQLNNWKWSSKEIENN